MKPYTKNELHAFLMQNGAQGHYSGKERTMFIKYCTEELRDTLSRLSFRFKLFYFVHKN